MGVDKRELLRLLAERLPHSRWAYSGSGCDINIAGRHRRRVVRCPPDADGINTAEYIAAADPAMILSLLNEIRQLKTQVAYDPVSKVAQQLHTALLTVSNSGQLVHLTGAWIAVNEALDAYATLTPP